jgi:hypothetical protein
MGICTGANPVVCTASDPCHIAGTCNPTTGVCSNPLAPEGTACSDGNACTITDTCQAGICQGAIPVFCAASDPCHIAGTCNPTTGVCSDPVAPDGAACSDGNACTITDTCINGACNGGNSVVCKASDQCHEAGTCNPTTGTCSNPLSVNGKTCDDGDDCTQTDACQTGACAGGNPVICTASDQCHGVGTCDYVTGLCSNPISANGTPCNDNNACTQTDTCAMGTCGGANPIVCSASDQCHAVGTCDPASGMCNDPAAPDGTACNDDNRCTVDETCQSGACGAPKPLDCNDNDACTTDTCDPAEGCQHAAAECTPVNPGGDSCECSALPGSNNDRGLPMWTLGGLLALLGWSRRRRERNPVPSR